eukprot:TRINITY_DN7859_c1_g1_i1.p1 TRINITY_DN7859_c1_g1~~TRINITY_DN7859_c1_g1_i1.p1  ORF type:complete len:331 (+),score=64.29 TRINITY_DN7859_c1_g1_i1:279-1271(+)
MPSVKQPKSHKNSMNKVKIFTGNSNKRLAEAICFHLGKPLGNAQITTFTDGETKVSIEENIRGYDVFVIQSTCPPVNDNLMELLIILDALRRASPKRITAVIPYFGYSRQDRKYGPREPITAKLVSDLITASGPDRILLLDLHANQIQGFFNLPCDNLLTDAIFVDYLVNNIKIDVENSVIVAPDVGGVRRARRVAKCLNLPIVLLEARHANENNVSQINVVGDLFPVAIIVDDMIDTGTRLEQTANKLKEEGVERVIACASHPVFSGNYLERINSCGVDEVIVSDSINVSEDKLSDKITILSVAPLLAEAIRRIHNEEPLEHLYGNKYF